MSFVNWKMSSKNGPNFRIWDFFCKIKDMPTVQKIRWEFSGVCRDNPDDDVYVWTADMKSFFLNFLIMLACRKQTGCVYRAVERASDGTRLMRPSVRHTALDGTRYVVRFKYPSFGMKTY